MGRLPAAIITALSKILNVLELSRLCRVMKVGSYRPDGAAVSSPATAVMRGA